MILRRICQVIETWAPPASAYDWDKVGLQLGTPEAEVNHALVCLSVTEEVCRAARETGAQLIVAHHPLIFAPLKALRTDDPQTRLCLDLAAANIACYVAHTNLDTAAGGVNDALADRLGLEDRRPLFPAPIADQVKLVTFVPESHVAPVRNAWAAAGAGQIGAYTHCTFSVVGTGTFLPGESTQPFSGRKGEVNEEMEHRLETIVPKARLAPVLEALFAAHPYEEVAYDVYPIENRDAAHGLGVVGLLRAPMPLERFAEEARIALQLPYVRVMGAPGKNIQRVACLGGAGGSEIPRLPAGVDVYLTGDIKYHDALIAHQRDVALIDAGHAGTEQCVVPILAQRLREALPGLELSLFEEAPLFRVLR